MSAPIQDAQRRIDSMVGVRHVVVVDRTSGKTPYAITKIGDDTLFWGSTGLVAVGETGTVPLTKNRQALGGSLFQRVPEITVYEEVGGGEQLSRATGPAGPSLSLSLRPLSASSWVLNWVGADERWDVVVTNGDTVTRDYIVRARGV